MRDLHNRRHALEHDDLVAPVELVGLAGREAQWHEGRRRRALLAPPSGGVAPHRIVAAAIAETAQLLEQPHQRQPFPARPRRVRCQKPFQLLPPRPQLRLRLHPPLVDERGLARADHLPHHLPRDLQLAADGLDRLALYEVPATYLRDRLHNQHPEPGSRDHGSTLGPHAHGVPFGRRSPRQRGPSSTPIHNGEPSTHGLQAGATTDALKIPLRDPKPDVGGCCPLRAMARHTRGGGAARLR
jgi:hypothetical protein